jgi:DHA2 family multidrug resistance protein
MQNNTVDPKNWIAFICMVFGMFMAVLDIQIVSSSLTEIQAGLSATKEEINWVQTSYLIAEVIIIPLCGWLTRVFSTRIIFSISCAGFTIMSLACALSWNLHSMIFFRALQGFFGGSMIPTTFASIYILFPLRMRPIVSVVVGLVVTLAPIGGPVIGGYITDYLSWHYLFLLNIIPGMIVTLLILKLVKFDQSNYSLLKNIDFPGIILITIALGTLQYTLEEGVRNEWFESKQIAACAVISFTAAIAMFYRELTTPHPIINLRAFRDRNFAVGCAFSFILGWGMFAAVFVMPVYLGSIKGLNSVQIGEYLFVTGLFQLLSAPCAGICSKKIDLRVMLAGGLLMFGIGTFLNYNITYESGFNEFFWPQAIRGFSLMFCFLPITTLTLGTLPPEEVQTASGLYNLMRNLGGAIGLAITNTWLQNWTKSNYLNFRNVIDHTNPTSNEAITLYQQNLTSFDYADPAIGGIKMLYELAQREAYIITFNQVLVWISFLFFISIVLMPLVKKVDPNQPVENSH